MKTLKVLGTAGVLAAAFAATNAYADAPRYDFFDLSYQNNSDPSGSGLSSDHDYGVSGSYAFTDNWIGGASYAHESADFNPAGFSSGTVSGNSYEAGIGYRFPLTASVDLVPNLSYAHESSDVSFPGLSSSTSGSGYDAGVLLRAMVTDKVELNASFDHTTPIASANTWGVGGLYNFTPAIAVGLGYSETSSGGQTTNSWTAVFRYYFK